MGAGTGGSSGYNYLMQTLEKHRIFTDLFALFRRFESFLLLDRCEKAKVLKQLCGLRAEPAWDRSELARNFGERRQD